MIDNVLGWRQGLPITPVYDRGTGGHALGFEQALYPAVVPQSIPGFNAPPSRQALVHAAHQFEAYFISYMLKVMRETVPEGLVPNKQGAYFHSFYDQEIGLRVAEAGGIGLARLIEEYAEKNPVSPALGPQVPGPVRR